MTTMQRIQGLIYGKPRSLLEIRIELHKLTGEHFMDTSIAARIRELRSQGFDVKTETLKREGKTAVYRYSIPKARKEA